jgi:hypothetical protein
LPPSTSWSAAFIRTKPEANGKARHHESSTLETSNATQDTENKTKQNRAEVENSFLKRKQRAGSKVDGKKQRQKIYLEEIPVLTGELFLLVACV